MTVVFGQIVGASVQFLNNVRATSENTDAHTKAHWRELATTWDVRSRIASEWLTSAQTVADVGCGLMTLEKLLPPAAAYIPIDIVARDHRTIVCDINETAIPDVMCDVVVMLGVLEYGDDVARIFEQLSRFPRTIFSYNHYSVNDLLWNLHLRKRRVTWRNRHTRKALRQLLVEADLQIIRERRVRMGERLYEVVPNPKIGSSATS